jgi:hypothetical protein
MHCSQPVVFFAPARPAGVPTGPAVLFQTIQRRGMLEFEDFVRRMSVQKVELPWQDMAGNGFPSSFDVLLSVLAVCPFQLKVLACINPPAIFEMFEHVGRSKNKSIQRVLGEIRRQVQYVCSIRSVSSVLREHLAVLKWCLFLGCKSVAGLSFSSEDMQCMVSLKLPLSLAGDSGDADGEDKASKALPLLCVLEGVGYPRFVESDVALRTCLLKLGKDGGGLRLINGCMPGSTYPFAAVERSGHSFDASACEAPEIGDAIMEFFASRTVTENAGAPLCQNAFVAYIQSALYGPDSSLDNESSREPDAFWGEFSLRTGADAIYANTRRLKASAWAFLLGQCSVAPQARRLTIMMVACAMDMAPAGRTPFLVDVLTALGHVRYNEQWLQRTAVLLMLRPSAPWPVPVWSITRQALKEFTSSAAAAAAAAAAATKRVDAFFLATAEAICGSGASPRADMEPLLKWSITVQRAVPIMEVPDIRDMYLKAFADAQAFDAESSVSGPPAAAEANYVRFLSEQVYFLAPGGASEFKRVFPWLFRELVGTVSNRYLQLVAWCFYPIDTFEVTPRLFEALRAFVKCKDVDFKSAVARYEKNLMGVSALAKFLVSPDELDGTTYATIAKAASLRGVKAGAAGSFEFPEKTFLVGQKRADWPAYFVSAQYRPLRPEVLAEIIATINPLKAAGYIAAVLKDTRVVPRGVGWPQLEGDCGSGVNPETLDHNLTALLYACLLQIASPSPCATFCVNYLYGWFSCFGATLDDVVEMAGHAVPGCTQTETVLKTALGAAKRDSVSSITGETMLPFLGAYEVFNAMHYTPAKLFDASQASAVATLQVSCNVLRV